MRNLATAALARGETARQEDRSRDACLAFSDAVEYFRSEGTLAELAHALTRRAQARRDLGVYDEAVRDQAEALTLYRSVAAAHALPHVLRHLGDILVDAGRPEEATAYFDEMLALYRDRTDAPPLEMANAIRSVAVHAEHRKDATSARLLWEEARDRYAALDDLFHGLLGRRENPGVLEADERLAALRV